MTTPAVTGTPSAFPDVGADPMQLIRQGRGQSPSDTREHADMDEYRTTKRPTGGLFDPAKHRAYLSGREPLAPIDYGPAADVVKATRASRLALAEAIRVHNRARDAVAPAEGRDGADEIDAAHAGKAFKPHHVQDALKALHDADVAAAVALRRAQLQEQELVSTLHEQAWVIRRSAQAQIDNERRELSDALDRIHPLVDAITEHESALGQFEQNHVLDQLPNLIIDLAPEGAPPSWVAPVGSPHERTLLDLFTEGRSMPRLSPHLLDELTWWAGLTPWHAIFDPDATDLPLKPPRRPEQMAPAKVTPGKTGRFNALLP